MTQQVSFTLNGKKYLACWSDVILLYEVDRIANQVYVAN